MKFGFTAEDFKDEKEFVQNLVDGEGEFCVKKVTDGASKAGVPMITIEFDVMQNGKAGTVRDFVTERSRFKLILLAKAVGDNDLKNKIKNDEDITELDLLNKTGKFIVEINGSYANVGKYLPAGTKAKEEVKTEEPPFNDDIPF